MRKAILVLLAITATAAADSDLRLALYAGTMLAVGEWAQVPEEPSRTMFGPDLGAELELVLRLDGVLWGLTAKYGRYDTQGYVGTGEEPNRVEEAEAGSLALLATAGLLLDDWGGVSPWVGLGLGVEWLRARETVGGREYDYGRVFLPAPCVGLTFGLMFHLTEAVFLPVKVSYDVSLGQVLGYGGYSGQGADLVLSAGLGVVF